MLHLLKLTVSLLLCTAALVFAETPQPPVADAAGDLHVMSFNIRNSNARDGQNHWNYRKDLFVSTIRAFNPDLLGLQEVCADQYDYLVRAFDDYSPIGVARDDGARAGEWSLIFFRKNRFEQINSGTFWLSEQPEKVGSRSWDAACVRICSWVKLHDRTNGRDLLYANTHFDHQSQPARVNSAHLLRKQLSQLAGGAAVVLTGDFNCGEDNEAYRTLVDLTPTNEVPAIHLLDSFRQVHGERTKDEGTFHGFTGKTTGERIDWILQTEQFKPSAAEIVRTSNGSLYPSDHFAVTAVLESRSKKE